MKRIRAVLAVATVLIALARPAFAHVGSPDVFYEGDAGPYHVFVTIRVPQVIPGVAEIDVRAASDDVRKVTTSVAWMTGPGSKLVPVPDLAKQSKTDPRFFTSSLWLMESGSMRVLLNVNGTRGAAQLWVPVASFSQSGLPMSRALGALLLALLIGLGLGAISIVAAAARESRVAPGAEVPPENRRRGMRAMVGMTVFIAALFYGGFVWWNADAKAYATRAMSFKSPTCAATLTGNRISIRPTDDLWLNNVRVQDLIPDHGHIMHLFLVRTPGLDRIWHLHPERTSRGTFEEVLPAIDAGNYRVFADVVGQHGFPWTLVGKIAMPEVAGAPVSGDDSAGTAAPLAHGIDTTTATLADGTQVVWKRDRAPLKANVPMSLKFEVMDRSGAPAADLEPYMGMAAHAEIIADDMSVFAHVHPSGSAPMASMMMASADTPGAASMLVMKNAGDKIAPEISIPYGFPKPGLYRIFLQFKRAGHVETAAFDATVQ